MKPAAKEPTALTFLRSSRCSSAGSFSTRRRRAAGDHLFDMFCLIELADHFEDGYQSSPAVLAKEGVVVHEPGNGGEVLCNGFLIDEPLVGRGGGLLFEA